MEKRWIKMNGDQIIDAITFEHPGYLRIEANSFPTDLGFGFYIWDGEKAVFSEEIYTLAFSPKSEE